MGIDKRSALSNRIAVAMLVCAAASTGLQAQERDKGQEPKRLTVLEEVLVTAQRREERVQDVPISITAISGEAIERLGANSPSDLIAQTPNVSSQMPTGGPGFPIFNIRGVTLLDFSDTNEASVAMYVDDVYLGSPAIQNGQLYDIERVEVLRGPQGTLYGRNATGGLVNFITRKPTEEFEAYIKGRYGSYDDVAVEGAVSGAMSEKVRARLAAFENKRGGWQDNEAMPGSDFGDIHKNRAVRLQMEVDATDALTVSGNIHYGLYEGDTDQRAFYGAIDPVSGTRCSDQRILSSQCVNASGFRDPDPDPEHVYSDLRESPAENENMGAWLRADWELDFATLTSITSHDKVDKVQTVDVDQSPMALLDITFAVDHSQWSQELRLTGALDYIDWVVGAYYYQDERFFTATLPNQGGYGSWADQEVETSAVFAQATWAVTETLNLTLGSRYTQDSRDLNNLAAITGGQPGTDEGTPLFIVSESLDSSRTTWRFAADWHFADQQMLYASVATGFKSGAYNTLLASNPAGVVPAKPEYTTAYELGLKGTFAALPRSSYNFAVFYTDYENVQAQGTIANPMPISSLDTVADADISGMEGEITFEALPGLTISLGAGYLDAEYVASSTALFNGVPIDGNELVMAPELNINGMVRYEHSLGDKGLAYASTDFRWQDDVYFGPENLETEAEDAYGIINVHAGWISADEVWEVSAFVKNAADEEYFTHGVDSGGASQVGFTWGMPRVWGVQVKRSF